MSDEQSTAQEPTSTPEQPEPKWGDPISIERQAQLQGMLDAWDVPDADHGDRKGPFEKRSGERFGVPLTGADVFWLAEQVRDTLGLVPNLHLEGANLTWAHLEGADLREAHLEGATLGEAHLEGASLQGADLKGASLGAAHLESANLDDAHLEGARLVAAWLDSKTMFVDTDIDAQTQLGDIQWSGVGAVNLTRLNWDAVPRLGDETALKPGTNAPDYEAAVRAYRQLGAQLRAQGMSEVADRFSYRAQFIQRRALRKRHQWGRWFGLWLLDLVSGHGYAPGRSLAAYAAINGLFAATYALLAFFSLTRERFESWDSPLVLSVTSFHGRVFFAGGLPLTDWAARVGALEAMVGLLIEITFIATFTQRFFGAK